LVTGRYSDGNLRDLTAQAKLSTADPGVAVLKEGAVRPAGDGSTTVSASVSGAAPASAPVTVREAATQAPISFRNDVVPALTKLEVSPGPRVLHQPARSQQLLVTATFADGSRRDVTPLTKFTASDDMMAAVSREGLVEAHRRVEVAIQCRYEHLVQSVRLT